LVVLMELPILRLQTSGLSQLGARRFPIKAESLR